MKELVRKFLPLAIVLLLALSVAAGAQPISFAGIWIRQPASGAPSARHYALVASDASGRVVLFGGSNESGALNDTWIWDGTNWAQQFPANSPPARANAAMASDASGHVVLFGGFTPDGDLHDTWTWDGTNWKQQFPANSPSARSGAAMAADGSGHVLLFGGTIENSRMVNDTWTWDGTNWMQQSPAHSPSGREAPSMASDRSRHIVLFGGMNENSRMLNETWTWDGANWTHESPANSPGARESAAMASDASGNIVLFGGYPGFGANDLDDTWSWDGTNWKQQHTPNGPSPRTEPALIYCAPGQAPGQVMLFGGTSQGALNDTWIYEDTSANFGDVKLGSHTTLILSFNIQVPVAVSGAKMLTQSQPPNADFTLNGASTCTGKLNADSSCTVKVTFAPRSPGLRTGAVQIMDNTGKVLTSTAIFGQGSGQPASSRPTRRRPR
ncbi:MAG TPA: kelch repeat-containing protein [Acidobacteriaceae bacterium]